ncbi:MAG: hypothetical protein JHC55_05670 [Mycolicibacterium sp.]|nr:hypothetical protein [Mycolicibacterium sp.]
MSETPTANGRDWRRLWCVPQSAREQPSCDDWNALHVNAIGSMWGRGGTPDVGAGVAAWSATIVADLTR